MRRRQPRRPNLSRERLRHWNPRLQGKLDPSDVVQDTMVVAHQRLGDYLRDQPVQFYPWLRGIALNQLVELYRRHVDVGKRSLDREEPMGLNDESAMLLANRLTASESSPSRQMMRVELKQRVQNALQGMPKDQREIIVMRYLEELPVKEIAIILNIAPGTVMSKHFRGLLALRRLLND